MEKIVYQLTIFVSRLLGFWFFKMVSSMIAAGFFVLFPSRVKISTQFYQALFPGRKFPFYLGCAWRQYQSFTRVFLDRHIFLKSGRFNYTSSGWEQLEKSVESKEGGIILMSHIGNWELAAYLLKQRQENLNLLLYLGIKHKEQIEKMQKESLADKGTKIIAVDQNGGSPFLLLESIKWMKEGGLVSLTGDRIWTEEQRFVEVDFLGHKAHLPETPHMLALLSGKPLFIMFSLPLEKDRMQIKIVGPLYVKADKRGDRKKAVQASAQRYADLLMDTARQFPNAWFHFEKFLQ